MFSTNSSVYPVWSVDSVDSVDIAPNPPYISHYLPVQPRSTRGPLHNPATRRHPIDSIE